MANAKRHSALLEKVDRLHLYPTAEGLALLKELRESGGAKFEESADVVFRLGLDPKQNENRIRGTVILPKGRGKTERILVFAKGEKQKEAEEAGADVAGADELIDKVSGGWLNYGLLWLG